MTALPHLNATLSQAIDAIAAQAGGDCASLVRAVAEETAAHARCRAVSMLYASGGPLRARAGDWPPVLESRLDAWERAVAGRSGQGATDLPDGPIPVSIARADEWMFCMVPLAAGGKAIGSVSLCAESARETELTQVARDISPWIGAILGLSALGLTASDIRLLGGAAAGSPEETAEIQRSQRAEIAGIMHQGPIQLLATVTMGLDHLERLASVQPAAVAGEVRSLKELTREATRESRLLLFELHPVSLDSEGLAATLEDYIAQMPEGDATVHFEPGKPIGELDPTVAHAAFHAAVQGLRHARTHGRADHVWLSLSRADEVLSILIEDDGTPQVERRCAHREGDMKCPEYLRQQLAPVRGTLEVRDGLSGEKPAFLIRIPVCSR